MAHEENDDIFFVPSDDDNSSETLNLQLMNPHHHDTAVSSMGDNQDGSGGRGPLDDAYSHLSAHPRHDDGPTSPGIPTMEDILFNRPTRKRYREDVPRSNDTATGFPPSSPPPPPLVQNAAWYAGGSPEAMPVGRPDLTPLALDNLRSMTCSDVREMLESFFVTKEANEHRFAAAKAEILLPLGDGTSSSSIAPAAKRRPCTPEEWRVRDRYVRLINVGNWPGDPAQDVLLPSALVPHSSYQHLQGTPPPPGETGAMKSEGSAPPLSIRPRTLRDHQIAGIRFLWNVLVEGPVGRVPAVGCILAHTMGLGKTAQVVLFSHFFAAAYTAPLLSGPGAKKRRLPRICIVAPKSTVPGWLKELESWSTSFPSAKRLNPLTLEDAARPDERVRVFQQWRRDGGIFLIGYEALTRLLQIVEMSGVHHDEATGGRATVAENPFGETVRRMLRQNGRVDEGAVPSGGPYDPYTELVVCDEAHRLKSLKLQVVTALRRLNPLRRMLLTGTPLQNHLSEYWSMVDFAMPKYFDQRRFKEYFVTPIESSVNSKATKFEVDIARKKTFTLINEVRHFVLRVDSMPLKKELPPLHEYVVVLPLTDLQRSLYLRFLAAVRSDTSERFHFLPAVSLAGKIACHPALVFAMKNRYPTPSQQTAPRSSVGAARGGARRGGTPSTLEAEPVNILSDDAEAMSKLSFSRLYRSTAYDALYDAPLGYKMTLDDSVKLRVAVEIIAQAVELGEKTLLFTLSTTLLDYLEALLVSENDSRARPIRHCRLDGSHTSRQRAALITDFHAKDGADVFLLSTKAGGVGITITAATRVILVDTSFNPADDQQAIGRAYRYGQERPVYVYRLLCQHTLEYSIFEQKLAKEWLFRTVVEDTAVKRDGLSGMRLRELFSLLGQSARALRNPPAPTARQINGTEVLAEEDSILRAIQPYIVCAKRYDMCLPIDPDMEYGEAEREFYTKYRRDRVFALEQGATEAAWDDVLAKRKQREEQAAQLRVQASSLAGMVDKIIRDRAGGDSNLAQLLNAMGVRVDAATGAVMMTNSSRSGPSSPLPPPAAASSANAERSSSSSPSTTPPEPRVRGRTGSSEEQSEGETHLSQSRGYRSTIPVLVDDSDDEEMLPQLIPSLADTAPTRRALVDPDRYYPHRPGGSAVTAMLIDDDDA